MQMLNKTRALRIAKENAHLSPASIIAQMMQPRGKPILNRKEFHRRFKAFRRDGALHIFDLHPKRAVAFNGFEFVWFSGGFFTRTQPPARVIEKQFSPERSLRTRLVHGLVNMEQSCSKEGDRFDI